MKLSPLLCAYMLFLVVIGGRKSVQLCAPFTDKFPIYSPAPSFPQKRIFLLIGVHRLIYIWQNFKRKFPQEF